MEFYQREETNLLRRTVNWIVDIVVVIAFAWFLVYGFGSQIEISGHSMAPVLRSGDVALMNQIAYRFGKPNRFDVVVFEKEEGQTYVKRVIGLPGEKVQIKEGQIYIDDQPLEAPDDLNQVSLAGLAKQPVLLGESEYFLLGDNRDNSEDSRFANIGNVSQKQIKGKIWLRLFPLIDIELIHS